MASVSGDFYRIQKLPPYVFAVINEMKAKARAAQTGRGGSGDGQSGRRDARAVVEEAGRGGAQSAQSSLFDVARHSAAAPGDRASVTARNYGVELDPETEAIVTIGAKDALAHLLFAVIGPGDTVVSPNPAYPIHQYGVIMAEGHACMLPMPDPATFLNRLEDLYNTSSAKPKMILISFPHNPTTQCVDLQFFRDMVGLARGTAPGWCTISLTPISASTATAAQHPAGGRAPRKWRSRFFRCRRATTWPDGAWAFAWGIAKMIAALARIKSYLDYGVFQPIQIASIIALRECDEETEEDLRHVSEAARRPGRRVAARGLAGGTSARIDVRVGADSGAATARRARWSSRNC